MSTTSSSSAEKKFLPAFFAAINARDNEAAVDAFKSAAFTSDGAPSPRAESIIEKGEWDIKALLSLVYVDDSCCKGRVGTEGSRFCGRRDGLCTVASHERNTVGGIKPGWYIANTGKSGGVFVDHHLPFEADGGPIKAGGAAFLTDGDQGFKMTKGQWAFVIDAWHAGRVMTSWDTEEEVVFETERLEVGDVDQPSSTRDTGPTEGADKVSPKDFLRDTLAILSQELNTESGPNESEDESEDEYYSKTELTELFKVVDAEMNRLVDDCRVQISLVKLEGEKAQKEASSRLHAMEMQNEALRQECIDAKTRVAQLTEDQKLAAQVQRGSQLATNQSLQAMRSRIDTLPSGSSTGSGITQGQADLLQRLEMAVLNPQGSLATLRTQFSTFRDKLESGGGVECASVSFNSKKELISWFEDQNLNIEIFLDALAFLHAIKAAVVHIEDAGRQREFEAKAKVTSTLQMAVVTSFDTIIPSVFVGAKKTAESGGSPYDWLKGNMKTFEAWKPVGMSNGVANQILEGIPKVTSRINELRRYQTTDTNAVLLSSGLCQDSSHFCMELVRFINEQHEELTQKTMYTSAQVWSMQLECLEKIIDELSEARESVADAARFQPAYYLWGMLKAWKVQQRYLENHFKDDPALTGIMVRRILMQGQDTSIRTKLEKIDELERVMKDHHKKEEEHRRNQMGEINKLKQNRNQRQQGGNRKDKEKE